MATDIIEESQQKDFESFDVFKTELRDELVSMANDRSMDFVKDLQGMDMLSKLAAPQKEKYANELWKKHFGENLEEIIAARVGVLARDIWEHQQSSIGFLEVSYNINLSLQESLRDALIKSFKEDNIDNSNKAEPGMGGDVISIVAGTVASGLAGKAEKNNMSTMLFGITSDYSATNVGEEIIKEKIQPKIAQSVVDAINELLDGNRTNGGAYSDIKEDINKFHAKQKSIIISALRQ